MGAPHVLVILFEFEPDSAREVMFREQGIPGPLQAGDFHPQQMQRPLAGMAGVQRFFNVGGTRAFCLFAVIGSEADRDALAPEVNRILAGITIDA
jgi:hypothetical protein